MLRACLRLNCLRLKRFSEKFLSIGVKELRDFRELREDDLVAMGMPLLQRRRFLMSAAVAVSQEGGQEGFKRGYRGRSGGDQEGVTWWPWACRCCSVAASSCPRLSR